MALYAAKAQSLTESDLYTLDPATAVATSVGATGHAFTGLAFDLTDGTLYGASSPNDGTTGQRRGLFTIDPETGTATFIAQFNGAGGVVVMSDIAFDLSGQLYGWSGETHNLHRIDKSDASYVDLGLGSLSVSPAALTFDPDDVLYLIGRESGADKLYTVNPATGIPTLIAALDPSTSAFPGAASFGVDGKIWWLKTNGVRLATLTTAGAWEYVVDSSTDPGNNFDALAWGPAPHGIMSKIKFGTGLDVTDEGAGVIRVDATGFGGAPPAVEPTAAVEEITSNDGSITVSDPTGPIVDLAFAGLPYIIFTGNSLGTADQCVWDVSPWADSGDSIAQVNGSDHRKIDVIPGLFLATFKLNSNANFARYYTGATDMSDYLSAGVEGTIQVPESPLAGATWMGSNDGGNRDVGEINLVFPFRVTGSGTNQMAVAIAYLRAAGYVAPNFSIMIVKIS